MMPRAHFIFYREKQNEKNLLLMYTIDKTVWQLPAVFFCRIIQRFIKTFY